MKRLFNIEKNYATNHMVVTCFGTKMKFKLSFGTKALEEEIITLKNILLRTHNITNVGKVLFYVPAYETDLIQKSIVERKKFFEQNLLVELLEFIPKKNAVILDIGANIGNHTLYWALLCNAAKIYSFEPIKSTYDILVKNIELNELKQKVNLFNVGLSDEKTSADIVCYYEDNIGGISVKKSETGSLLLDKLDNIEIKESKIDFVKIDVEGHELLALKGATKTLEKYKPAIFIETGDINKVSELLNPLGYKLRKEFENCNYLFVNSCK